MRRRLWGGVGGLALLGFATASMAQTVVPTGNETSVISSVNIAYDSNVAQSDRENAEARGISLADEVLSPNVNLALARQVGRQLLFLTGDVGYVFHVHDTVLNRQNIAVMGGATARYLSCNEVLTGEVSSAQSDLADVQTQVTKNVVNTETAALTANCGRGNGFAPGASVSETWRDNSAEQLISNDSRTFAASASLGYQRPVLGSVSLFGSFSQASFPHQFIAPEGPTYGYDLYAGGVSIQRSVGRINGNASISYSTLVPNTSTSPGFSGLTYSVDARYQMSTRLGFHVLASRATTPSNVIGASYSISQTVEADANYQAGSRLTLSLTGSYGTRDYQGGSSEPLGGITHSTTGSIYANAAYHLGRRFTIALNAGDEEHHANVTSFTYSATKVGITFSATFGH